MHDFLMPGVVERVSEGAMVSKGWVRVYAGLPPLPPGAIRGRAAVIIDPQLDSAVRWWPRPPKLSDFFAS